MRVRPIVRAALEQPLSSWDYCGGWDGFMHYVIAIHWLLHCLHVVISGCSPLSPAQTETMLAWGQKGISRVCERLRDFRWQGLHAGCVSGTQPGEQTCILTFPHLASEYFIAQVIDPSWCYAQLQKAWKWCPTRTLSPPFNLRGHLHDWPIPMLWRLSTAATVDSYGALV